jgi:hypothetical protein
MIYGKRDATGLYQDNRLKNHRETTSGVDRPIEASMQMKKDPTMRMPLAARIKAIFRDLRGNKSVTANKIRSYEIEIFPSHIQASKPRSQISAKFAIKSRKQIGALLLAGRSNQFRTVRPENGCNEVQTPSNLG